MITLEKFLDIIRQGGEVRPEELLPYLSQERRSDRFIANDWLARTYYYAGKPDQASVFAARALLLLKGDPESFISFYVLLQTELGNIEAIKNAYKIVGMQQADAGNIPLALEYFNHSRDAYVNAGLGDHYEYDFDILKKIETLAYSSPQKNKWGPSFIQHDIHENNGKIRLAYLVYGANHPQSILIKILCDFANYHDQSRYDVAFFVPSLKTEDAEQVKLNIEKLCKAGGRVIATTSKDKLESLYETAHNIREFAPYILITTAVLADYDQYFISMLVSAPVKIGLCYGPPTQFIPLTLDWVISSAVHPLLDSPCDGSIVYLERELPIRATVSAYTRQELGIPPDSVIILSAGRSAKLRNREFWTAIVKMLEDYPQAFFIAIGLTDPPPFLAELMRPALKTRFMSFGWRNDYLNILAIADIVVDTFPSGGGVTVMDAMGLAIPVVSFRNDYTKVFDQTDWNLVEEIIDLPELIVSRGRFDQWSKVLSNLIEDKEYRQRLGRQCQEMVKERRGSPERMIRNHEQIYDRVLANNKYRIPSKKMSSSKDDGEALC